MLQKFYYSFPVQLFLYQLRSNYILSFSWIILFLIVTGNFGRVFGIPYLFLDPEYLGRVGFGSFLILGLSLGGFTMAYNITGYITSTHLFSFLGTISRPFSKYSLNNFIIPGAFLLVYIIAIIRFQTTNQYSSSLAIAGNILGLILGYAIIITLFLDYFRLTNKDVFQVIASNVEKRLKSVPITRGNVLNRYRSEIKSEIRVDSYINLKLRVRNIRKNPTYFRKEAILKVFGQNHLNSVIIGLSGFAILFLLGIFREYPIFQIPAAASAVLILTLLMMMSGAVFFWVKKWAIPAVLILFLLANYLTRENVFTAEYQAPGLNYGVEKADYSLKSLRKLTFSNIEKDIDSTEMILDRWKAKFPEAKPKMVFVCVSGGGQRSALWTLRSLQYADSLTGGKLLDHTVLITGASGGMIGASYLRELLLLKRTGKDFNLYDPAFQDNISSDNLNPIILSLLVNDLFVRYQSFSYNDHSYLKDRGYAFEQQLNANTGGVLDKPLKAYKEAEKQAIVPMLFIAPTIINDNRKLYISPLDISYMNLTDSMLHYRLNQKIRGIEFQRIFENQEGSELRFLSALRMGATFPYISPNVTLPSQPGMQIMDAGITDMYGISDATRFMYVFSDWIKENTSGAIILTIRDSEKIRLVEENVGESLVAKITDPVIRLYTNIGRSHDLRNDSRLEFASEWLDGSLDIVELQYISGPDNRAALNWRLTNREKEDIIQNIHHSKNERSLKKLSKLLE